MSVKKTELKVSINCLKCKTGVLKAVAKLEGVNEVKLDAEKGVLTVLGTVDPVCMAKALRKAGYFAEITSVGPPKKPDDKEKEKGEKEKGKKEKKEEKPLPPCCKQCQLVGVVFYDSGGAGCSIL